MSVKNTKAMAAVETVLSGSFKGSADVKKLLAKQQAQLRAAGLDSKVGYVQHAGRVKDGTFQVQFNSGSDGWSSRWPDWAYEPARDSVLHSKKVWVIYEGEVPFGDEVLLVLVLSAAV